MMSNTNSSDSKQAKDKVEVLFRKATPINDPEGRYPGFKPSKTVLAKGSVHKKGALPLPCDIIFERDVAAPLRDGSIIYADIFRPSGLDKAPAIVAWSPYGKGCGWLSLDIFPWRMGVHVSALSGLETFEGPDPAYWCNHGYAVVHPDARGVFSSQGDIHFWGSQEAEDGYDFIEWVAAQSWSNGKVGLTGNSWLAISQYYIASIKPPHLAAIAPWEGQSDFYRDSIARGGIPNIGFNEVILMHLYGNNRIEDIPAMITKYPLMNSYWEDKVAKLEKIETPAYVVASYTNELHTVGTFKAFRQMSSKDKWLRVHNTMEWPDYYIPEHVDDLRRFFDRYLKDIQNGWEQTPRVRLSVLDPGGTDLVGRVENEFPMARTQYQKLFLDANSGKLSPDPLTQEAVAQYRADDDKGQATFTIKFDKDTELIGYMKLCLWVEATDTNDMDLFVFIQKLNKKGKRLGHMIITPPNRLLTLFLRLMFSLGQKKVQAIFYSGPNGRLRVSHRQLDTARSTPSEPYLTHTIEELLSPGEIVPVEIPIWPTGMRWRAGEQLYVVVAGYNQATSAMAGLPKMITRNKGEHIIHTGGKYDSHLLVPMIPS